MASAGKPEVKRQDSMVNPSVPPDPSKLLSQYLGWDGLSKFPPEQIEKLLTLVGTLGNGAVGLVDEVKGPNPNRPSFVRKRVYLEKRKRKTQLKVVREEAKVIEDLVHTHIVHIFGTYEHNPKTGLPSFSLLMFPVGDGDLLQLLGDISKIEDETPSSKRDWLVHWFYCLTSALEYIHKQGVRHEDIKPSNIIHIGRHVLFTDFSSSSRFDPGATTSTENPACASEMYSAPEVLEKWDDRHGYKRHGTGSDVFSLGCVFMEMLTIIGLSKPSALQDHLKNGKWHFLPQVLGGSPPSGTGFCYGLSTSGADTFFEERWQDPKVKKNVKLNGNLYFQKVISPMLQSDRKKRPSASNILAAMEETEPDLSSCTCSSSYLPNENAARRPSSTTNLAHLGRIYGVEMRSSFEDFYSNDIICPGEHVAVLWAYHAQNEDEFELEGGELIQVLGLWEDGWGSGIKLVHGVEKYLENPEDVSEWSETHPDKRQIGAFPLVSACLPQYWRKARHEKMEEIMMELVNKRNG